MHKLQPSLAASIVANVSQRTQIIGYVAELPNHLGVSEIPGGRVACAAKRDRADVAFFARERFSAHHSSVGI
jgi:hypothetical protein